jgi:large subunit ribosomal protein L12
MEYIYSALLLHSAGGQISEENVKKVLEAAGVSVDEARVKALTASLEGVDIEEAIEKAAAVPAAAAPAAGGAEAGGKAEEAKEEEEEEEAVSEEEAAAGLGSLFG